jgi:predicted DNA-binding protein YlxM (UPF0122 family)
MSSLINFTESQIADIINSYAEGQTLSEIGEKYNVSRPTIQKVVKGNYPAYTGKKRAIVAKEGQTKICSKCRQELPLEAFNKGNSLYGRRSFCRECEKKIQNTPDKRKRRRELEILRRQDPEYVKRSNERDKIRVHSNPNSIKLALLRSAKQRAKIKGLEFNIDVTDIELPEVCPLLGIPLFSSYREEGKTIDYSYSIDRINPNKGYIKGNVWVISYKANRIKNDASLEELELLVKNLKDHWIH